MILIFEKEGGGEIPIRWKSLFPQIFFSKKVKRSRIKPFFDPSLSKRHDGY